MAALVFIWHWRDVLRGIRDARRTESVVDMRHGDAHFRRDGQVIWCGYLQVRFPIDLIDERYQFAVSSRERGPYTGLVD